MTIPAGATHFSEFYGAVTYWRKREVLRLNSVSGELQKRQEWSEWDGGAWRSTDASFSSRRCLPIDTETTIEGLRNDSTC